MPKPKRVTVSWQDVDTARRHSQKVADQDAAMSLALEISGMVSDIKIDGVSLHDVCARGQADRDARSVAATAIERTGVYLGERRDV